MKFIKPCKDKNRDKNAHEVKMRHIEEYQRRAAINAPLFEDLEEVTSLEEVMLLHDECEICRHDTNRYGDLCCNCDCD